MSPLYCGTPPIEQPFSDPRMNLEAEWSKLCESTGVASPIATSWFQKLSALYSEPTRFYHTLNHIEEMTKWIVQYESKLKDVPSVQFATWFHEYACQRRRQSFIQFTHLVGSLMRCFPLLLAVLYTMQRETITRSRVRLCGGSLQPKRGVWYESSSFDSCWWICLFTC